MKARFDSEQPSVRFVSDSDKIYIFIAVNGKWTETVYDETQDPQTVWECDYREIVTSEGRIDLEKVKENPSKYLDWIDQEERSAEEKIAELQDQNKMLTQCLMEMSEIVYA